MSLRIDKGALDRTRDRGPARPRRRDRHRAGGTPTWTSCWSATCRRCTHRAAPRPGCGRRPAGPAMLLCDGTPFDRETSRPDRRARRPTIEIDFDLESSADGRVYLWGFWVERPSGAGDPARTSSSPLRRPRRGRGRDLAREAFAWLRRPVVRAARRRSAWRSTTTAGTRWPDRRAGDRAIRRPRARVGVGVRRAGRSSTCSRSSRTHFFGVGGLGLKLVAHARAASPGATTTRAGSTRSAGSPTRCTARRRRCGPPARHGCWTTTRTTSSPPPGPRLAPSAVTRAPTGRRVRADRRRGRSRSRLSVRRCARSITASTISMPSGGSSRISRAPRPSRLAVAARRPPAARPARSTPCGGAEDPLESARARAVPARAWRRCCRRRRWPPRSAGRDAVRPDRRPARRSRAGRSRRRAARVSGRRTASATPTAVDTRPSMPARPRLAKTAGAAPPTGGEVEVADRVRRADDQGVALAPAPTTDVGRDRRAGEVGLPASSGSTAGPQRRRPRSPATARTTRAVSGLADGDGVDDHRRRRPGSGQSAYGLTTTSSTSVAREQPLTGREQRWGGRRPRPRARSPRPARS